MSIGRSTGKDVPTHEQAIDSVAVPHVNLLALAILQSPHPDGRVVTSTQQQAVLLHDPQTTDCSSVSVTWLADDQARFGRDDSDGSVALTNGHQLGVGPALSVNDAVLMHAGIDDGIFECKIYL